MVEMVDTPDLKSCAFKRPSSILGEDTSIPTGWGGYNTFSIPAPRGGPKGTCGTPSVGT